MTTPAITPQPQMSMDNFAGAIKAKYPGQYDQLDNQELANRVLAKYPMYRQHVNIKPPADTSQAATGREAALGFASGMGIPESETPVRDIGKGLAKTFEYGPNELDKSTFDKAMSYIPVVGPAYRMGAGMGEKLYGDARDFISNDPERVAHAGASGVGTLLTLGLGNDEAPIRELPNTRIGRTAGVLAKTGAKLGDASTFGVLGKGWKALKQGRGELGDIWQKPPATPDVAPAEAPETPPIRLLRESLARPNTPYPRVSEGLPEVEAGQPEATAHLRDAVQPNPPGNARLDLRPTYPGAELPERPEQVLLQGNNLRRGPSAGRPPQSSGLAAIPVRREAPPVYPGANLPDNPAGELLQSRPLATSPQRGRPAPSSGLGRIPVRQQAPTQPPVEAPAPAPPATTAAVPPVEAPKPGLPSMYATDEQAWQRYPAQDAAETRDLQAQAQETLAQEQRGRLNRGNEEGFALNTRPSTPKGELQKRFENAPPVEPAPDLNNPEVLQKELERSVQAATAKTKPEQTAEPVTEKPAETAQPPTETQKPKKLTSQEIADIEDKMARAGGSNPKPRATKSRQAIPRSKGKTAGPAEDLAVQHAEAKGRNLEQRALSEGGQPLTANVPKEGANFEGRYVRSALEPAEQAWRGSEPFSDHQISWAKDTPAARRDGLRVNMHDPEGNYVASLEIKQNRDGYQVLAKGTTKGDKYGNEAYQVLDNAPDLSSAKRMAEERLRTGQVYDPKGEWNGRAYGQTLKTSNVTPHSQIDPSTVKRPAGFTSDKLVVKVPDDGTFVVKNRPSAIANAIKKTDNFVPEKTPKSFARRVPKSPTEFNAEAHITSLEKEIAGLEDQLKKMGYNDLGRPHLEEQLKAARENLAEAKGARTAAAD